MSEVVQPQEEAAIYRAKLREKRLALIPLEAAEVAGEEIDEKAKTELEESVKRLQAKIKEIGS